MSELLRQFKYQLGLALNHEFYFFSLAPAGPGAGGDLPKEDSVLYKKITDTWGSFDEFYNEF